ncbi:MAG: 50S ribosomal protein L34e [Candidatus Iainarchaeum archaeon]|mgnify:CR=1 FL=1|uniref:Large ribosomal subunit protein eL34 n=1 Tax=Candidatus Iainarchaeum sp. TaxID=3101447 RepID=A0A497JGU3_9ARCH|nr:MAG: 50S ribosomal protein L34e [Candidatus Diapherotrites archaeon]
MVRPGQKTKNKKYRKTPGGESKVYFERDRHGKASCALCGSTLAGVPRQDEVKKLSKTERRPSTIFAGVLCNKCRSIVLEEAIKVKHNIKSMQDCKISIRPYIEQALKLLK